VGSLETMVEKFIELWSGRRVNVVEGSVIFQPMREQELRVFARVCFLGPKFFFTIKKLFVNIYSKIMRNNP